MKAVKGNVLTEQALSLLSWGSYVVGRGTGCCGHVVHNIPFVGGEQAGTVRWTENFVVMLTRRSYKV